MTMATSSRSALLLSPLLSPLLLLLLLHSAVSVAESHPESHRHALPAAELRRDLQDEVSVASLADEAGPWNSFKLLLNAKLGDARAGVGSVKRYLLQFGYIDVSQAPPAGANFTDTFDNVTQNAIILYQRSFGLTETGRLDIATLTQMVIPRCGREDVVNGTLLMLQDGLGPNATGTQHWSASFGNPKWAMRSLTYAINEEALSPLISLSDTETTMARAFAKWAAVSSLTFTRAEDLTSADITIGFVRRDHGDGSNFDGPLGVLAHAFAPSDGRLHFDVDEAWSVNVTDYGKFDLMSVAIHEIGHLLGLSHTNYSGAVMYPSIRRSKEVRVLSSDDIAGVQTLHGPNPANSANPSPPSPPADGPSLPGTDSNAELGSQSAAVASWRRMRVGDVVAAVAALTALCLVLAPGSRA